MKISRIVGTILILFFIMLCMSIRVKAEPSGSNIDPIGSSRYTGNNTEAKNISAQAGNVTEMSLFSFTATQNWQGYFGNVSGAIILADSQNNTLYNWTTSTPTGEVYATRLATVPSWATIRCANTTEKTTEDVFLNAGVSDPDSVTNTFSNGTAFTPFYVGPVLINGSAQDCHALNTNNDTGSQNTYFSEVLLSDGANTIYTSVIENDANGFDNSPHDFQMMVGEDGHDGDVATTDYFFYLELA